jgi:hypothetical protein
MLPVGRKLKNGNSVVKPSRVMAGSRQSLWPFGSLGAQLAAPLIWLALGASFSLSHHFLTWPNKESGNTILLLAVAVGLVPTLLAVLDYRTRTKPRPRRAQQRPVTEGKPCSVKR